MGTVGKEAEARRAPVPPVFDGYRGLVILCIVFLHVTRYVDWQPRNELLRALRLDSYFTIDFMFVVSGFLLFLPVAARGTFGSTPRYAIRRMGRIVPAYLVSLVATYVLALAIGHPPFALSDVEIFVAHLFFIQHELNVSGYGVNEVYWFLSILAIFYVLLPLVANRYLRHPLIGLALAVLIMVLWRGLTIHVRYILLIQFPLFVADFAIGMTAAWAFMRIWRSAWRERLARYAVPAMLVSAGALLALLLPVGMMRLHNQIWFFGEPPAYALAIPLAFVVTMGVTAFAPTWVQWPFANRGTRWLGKVSYGVFLYHVIVLQIAVRAYGFHPQDHRTTTVLALLAAIVPVSLVLGWVSWRFVETPVNRRVGAYLERSKARGSRRARGGPDLAERPAGSRA